jgi:hypothetical protein
MTGRGARTVGRCVDQVEAGRMHARNSAHASRMAIYALSTQIRQPHARITAETQLGQMLLLL